MPAKKSSKKPAPAPMKKGGKKNMALLKALITGGKGY